MAKDGKPEPRKPLRSPIFFPKPTFAEEHFQPFCESIGRATLAWNSLHEALGLVFCAVVGDDDGTVAIATWNAIRVDRTKRDILRDAAKAALVTKFITARVMDAVCLMHEKAEKIEQSRNNAVHTPFIYSIKDRAVVPSLTQGNPRAIESAKKDVLPELNRLYLNSISLRDYALDVQKGIRHPRAPWPGTPQLL